jgi:DNA segregation ATPase FtsK/SpoIIIE-like protein
VRLVGSVASPEDAKVASGLAATGAERLLGQGDFLVVAKGQVSRLQAAYVDTGGIRTVVSWLARGAQPLLLPETATSTGRGSESGLDGRLPVVEPRQVDG